MSLVLSVFGNDIGEVAITIPFKRLDLLPHSGHVHPTMPCLKLPMSKQELSIRQKDTKLPLINPNAAGIDIGADRHWVSVPVGRDRAKTTLVSGLFIIQSYRLPHEIKNKLILSSA